MSTPDPAILEISGLKKHFVLKGSVVRALDGVDLSVKRGECVGIVGESGSGKTTLARLILGVAAASDGDMTFQGEPLTIKRARSLRRHIQVVQQNPLSTLNPKRTIRQALELPLRVHGIVPRRERRNRAIELLDTVGLTPEYLSRYPNALSGGQRQRAALARALAAEPDIIILDEPTSALDVSVQARVLTLLDDLRKRLDLTYLFITHDLSVIRNMASRIAVMYRGRFVETGPTKAVFSAPKHRYTTMLLSSVPVVTKAEEDIKPHWPWSRSTLEAEERPSKGCAFAPRCPFASDLCWSTVPPNRDFADNHFAACHHPNDEEPSPDTDAETIEGGATR